MTAARIRKLAESARDLKVRLKEDGHPLAFDARMMETRLHELANDAENGIWDGGA